MSLSLGPQKDAFFCAGKSNKRGKIGQKWGRKCLSPAWWRHKRINLRKVTKTLNATRREFHMCTLLRDGSFKQCIHYSAFRWERKMFVLLHSFKIITKYYWMARLLDFRGTLFVQNVATEALGFSLVLWQESNQVLRYCILINKILFTAQLFKSKLITFFW